MIREFFLYGGRWTVECRIPPPYTYTMMNVEVCYELAGQKLHKEYAIKAWNINELDKKFDVEGAKIIGIRVLRLRLSNSSEREEDKGV